MSSCSLVCVDWANRCRAYLFRGATVVLKSQGELSILEAYAITGSPRLIPLNTLIRSLKVEQTWESPAWCYQVCNSRLSLGRRYDWILEDTLVLRGPVPADLPPAAYRSPHWSLPRTMPKSYLAFKEVTLRDVHFPSLPDLVAFLRHFVHWGSFTFINVTWSSSNGGVPVTFRRSTEQSGSKPYHITAEGCTDHVLPCIMTYGSLWPLSYMTAGERDTCTELIRETTGLDSGSRDFKRCSWFRINHGRECDAFACTVES